jgi:hypothetical protein
LAPGEQTEAVFEVSTNSKYWNGRSDRDRQLARCGAATEPDWLWTEWTGGPDAIIASLMDGAIVQQQGINPAGECRPSLGGRIRKRLSWHVRTGHNQWAPGIT